MSAESLVDVLIKQVKHAKLTHPSIPNFYGTWSFILTMFTKMCSYSKPTESNSQVQPYNFSTSILDAVLISPTHAVCSKYLILTGWGYYCHAWLYIWGSGEWYIDLAYKKHEQELHGHTSHKIVQSDFNWQLSFTFQLFFIWPLMAYSACCFGT
jgi:hypothetical protein